MSVKAFNDAFDKVFKCLLKAAKTDKVYYKVKSAQTMAHTATQLQEDMIFNHFRTFVARPAIVEAVRKRDTATFFDVIAMEAPELGLQELELANSLKAMEKGTEKRMWKKMRKAIECCGIDLDAQPLSEIEQQRVSNFNQNYFGMLRDLSAVFGGEDVLVKFERAVEEKETVAYDAFKGIALPRVPNILADVENAHAHVRQLLETPDFVLGLPFVSGVAIDSENWKTEIVENEQNIDVMTQTFHTLFFSLTGLQALFEMPVFAKMREYAERVTGGNTDVNMSPDNIMTLATSMISEMQQDGGLAEIMGAVQPLLQGGRNGVIDEDVLKTIAASPDIMDKVGNMIPGIHGLTQGSTGAPAFGSVSQPAWIKEGAEE